MQQTILLQHNYHLTTCTQHNNIRLHSLLHEICVISQGGYIRWGRTVKINLLESWGIFQGGLCWNPSTELSCWVGESQIGLPLPTPWMAVLVTGKMSSIAGSPALFRVWYADTTPCFWTPDYYGLSTEWLDTRKDMEGEETWVWSLLASDFEAS